MTFTERDQVVEALPADGSDQPFAEGIGLWCANRRFEHPDIKISKSGIHILREDRVAVVNDELTGVIVAEELAELLNAPFSGRVLSDVEVENAA